MKKLCEAKFCSGCGACAGVCPIGCISMESDREGFLRPVIDEERCVSCNSCHETCPILIKQCVEKDETVAYAAINIDEQVRLDSTSGGVFSLLCQWILNQGGVVFGATYDEGFNVIHCEVEDVKGLHKLRGAKYTQSDLSDSYKKVQMYLDNESFVLFSGTPCQVGGLKAFLGKEYNNLMLVDLICHGVPSPAVWRKYVEYRSDIDADGVKPSNVNFRSKETGWTSYSVRFDYPNGKCYSLKNGDDPFMRGFIGNLYLRPSCYNCNYKGYERSSDFTLGDYWGVWTQEPELYDEKGTSLVLLHTNKAKECWGQLSDKIKAKQVDIEKSLEENPCAIASCSMPNEREVFFLRYKSEDFANLVEELYPRSNVASKSVSSLLKQRVRKIIRKVKSLYTRND